MRRSILRRYVRFSAIALILAIAASVGISLMYSTNAVIDRKQAEAVVTAREAQMLLLATDTDGSGSALTMEVSSQVDDLPSPGSTDEDDSGSGASGETAVASTGGSATSKPADLDDEALALLKRKLRNLCIAVDGEVLAIYDVNPDATTASTVQSATVNEKVDAELPGEWAHGGNVEGVPEQMLAAARDGFSDDPDFISTTSLGSSIGWYFPIQLQGSDKIYVLGVFFDADHERTEIVGYALAFAIPLAIIIGLVILFGLLAIKRDVADPLKKLSARMRSFIQDGVHARDEKPVSKTSEIAGIEASFNQMSHDIELFVEHIRKMTDEQSRAAAELNVARRIQLGLVPPVRELAGDGFDSFAFERTARAVGGDFYDLALLGDGRVLCMIADVSGKGVSAALFMAMVLTLLHEKLVDCDDPAVALNEVNDLVAANNPENMFVTLVAAIFDPATRELTFANAGHTPPLIVGGEYVDVDPGFALGVFENVGIVSQKVTLEPGQGILFYTDGATEAVSADDSFFGEQRRAQGAVRAAVDAVDVFAKGREQFDDLTLLALFATGDESETWEATVEPSLDAFDEISDHVREICGESPKTKMVLLACDEIFTNVVSYSGASGVGISIRREGGSLTVAVSDDGAAFDPLARERHELVFDELDQGGMGLMLVRKVTEDIAYERVGEKNVLTMRFAL